MADYLHPVNVGGRAYLAPLIAPTPAPTQAPTQPPTQTPGTPITVPASRTATFAGRSRLIVFTGETPVSVPKVPGDELYYVGDFTKDLGEAATTAVSVAPVSNGLVVLEAPVLQGNFGVVKLGGFNTAPGAKNYFTFRVTCANGEQFDRTMEFTAAEDGGHVFGKDPDDKRLYALDLSSDATFGGSALASVQTPTAVGVSVLSAPVVQGNLIFLKIGGLDTADGAPNSCSLAAVFANSEKLTRTIYFTREDH